jgi:hypothetical protein
MSEQEHKVVRTAAQAMAQQRADAERDHAPKTPATATTAVATTDAEAAVDNYLAEHAGGGGATFLKWSKDAEFVRTSDDEPIPFGTTFIVVYPQIRVGRIKFNGKGNQPTRHMGLLFGGYVMPDRETLGDNDQSLWEPGLDGAPRDPWLSQILLPLVGVDDDQPYIFQTTSQTGRNSVGRLITACRRMQKREPDQYPVVRLDKGGFTNRRGLWVDVPQFTPVGRTPIDGTKQVDTSIAADLNDEVGF